MKLWSSFQEEPEQTKDPVLELELGNAEYNLKVIPVEPRGKWFIDQWDFDFQSKYFTFNFESKVNEWPSTRKRFLAQLNSEWDMKYYEPTDSWETSSGTMWKWPEVYIGTEQETKQYKIMKWWPVVLDEKYQKVISDVQTQEWKESQELKTILSPSTSIKRDLTSSIIVTWSNLYAKGVALKQEKQDNAEAQLILESIQYLSADDTPQTSEEKVKEKKVEVEKLPTLKDVILPISDWIRWSITNIVHTSLNKEFYVSYAKKKEGEVEEWSSPRERWKFIVQLDNNWTVSYHESRGVIGMSLAPLRWAKVSEPEKYSAIAKKFFADASEEDYQYIPISELIAE